MFSVPAMQQHFQDDVVFNHFIASLLYEIGDHLNDEFIQRSPLFGCFNLEELINLGIDLGLVHRLDRVSETLNEDRIRKNDEKKKWCKESIIWPENWSQHHDKFSWYPGLQMQILVATQIETQLFLQ